MSGRRHSGRPQAIGHYPPCGLNDIQEMIMKVFAMAVFASAAALLAAPAATYAEEGKTPMTNLTSTASTPDKSGHLEINGVNYYYEIRGTGAPLLLLHGGLGIIEMFEPILPILGAGRQIIGVDLHGHGRTPLGERPISLEAMGDDMAELIKRLGTPQVDVLGCSMGGGVALRMAIQHPDSVRRLALISTPFGSDGFYPEIQAAMSHVGGAMAEGMKSTPMYRSYAAVAPKVEDFPKLLDAMGKAISKPYDWSSDVKTLKMPVMLVYGDSDMFRPEHIVKFYQLLGGGLRDAGWMRETMAQNRLAILPDLTHYEIFASPAMAQTVLPFLDGKSGAKSWSEQIGK
jgi:pimeloyl-ACP methyl ester carboxylesterase